MTDEELDAIRERAEKARDASEAKPTLDEQFTAWFDDGPRRVADSADDVPALIAEIERLWADRGELHPCFICGTPTDRAILRADGRALSTDPEVLEQLAREHYRCSAECMIR